MGPIRRIRRRFWTFCKAKHAPATFFVIGSNANQYLGLAEARIRRRPRNRKSHLHAPGVERNFARAARPGTESDRTPFRQHAGRENLAVPPAVRYRPSAGNRRRSFSRCRFRSRWDICSLARASIRTIGAKPSGVPPASAAELSRQRVLEQAQQGAGNIVLLHDGGGDRTPHHAGPAGNHRRFARRGFRIGARLRSDSARSRAQVMLPLISANACWRTPTL